MIYIENHHNDPTYNLAFEEYVFTKMHFEEPVLLLWQNRPAVIVGIYQNTLEEINYDHIREKGIQVVRRNTGGGAGYHDLGNLNYSFIINGVDSKVDFRTFTSPVGIVDCSVIGKPKRISHVAAKWYLTDGRNESKVFSVVREMRVGAWKAHRHRVERRHEL